MTGGRILGLDPGTVRIGVAISDDAARVALPRGSLDAGDPGVLHAIAEIANAEGVDLIVVGNPLHLKGGEGEQSRRVAEFAQGVREATGVEVVLHDERLTTVEATRALGQAGVSGRRARRRVDASAATIMLQSYLDSRRKAGGRLS